MPRPQRLIDSVETAEGRLELRQRGEADFMILIGGRVLMTSYITHSELFLAEQGCALVRHSPVPRVLIGGLGLGFTLRAALDALPPQAEVVVAELNPKVIEWCRGPVAQASGGATLDKRVRFFEGDVTAHIAQVADDADSPRYDAILWDLYVGPTRAGGEQDPLYGDRSVQQTAHALSDQGVFGVWGETPSPAFEARLKRFGLMPDCHRVGHGGLKHAVYLARKSASPRAR
jgi:spermidine synthase